MRFYMFDSFYSKNMNHDLFRWKGLSKNGLRLFAFMRRNPGLTISQIANNTGLHQKTIRRKISKMKSAGLITTNSNNHIRNYSIIDNPDIDRAAVILGTAGAGERQRVRHQQERKAWRIKQKFFKNNINGIITN